VIEPRPATGLLVSALIRRIEAEGGSAMVIAKGDAIAGAILLLLADRGIPGGMLERVWRFEGGHGLDFVGPTDPDKVDAMTDYVARRRRSDPDLWAVELDHPEARRIAEEMLL
jgi:hypothetical protein